MYSVLKETKLSNGRFLAEDQINHLLNIQYPGNTGAIISEENLDLSYQIITSIQKFGYESTIKLMEDQSILTPKQEYEGKIGKDQINEGIIFGSDEFSDLYKAYINNANIIREPVLQSEGLMDCPKCHSSKTQSVQKFIRAADEPPVNYNSCDVCKYKWKT
jgi:DNA-directed RNA polymerase subunit M/transcription elongation factor TFIIS